MGTYIDIMTSTSAGKSAIHYIGSDGSAWGSFLQKKLSEDQYGIPTVLHEIGTPLLEANKYDVNIVLVSPDFLTLESFEKFQRCSTVDSLAILLGTNKSEFHEAVSRENPKNRLLKWLCYRPQQTQDSVKVLLLTIINLYENLHGGDEVDDDESCPDDPLFQLVPEPCSNNRSSGECENTDDYDILPPTRQINDLHDVMQLPCSEGDDCRELLILLDRKADSELMLTLDSGENIQTEEIDQAVYKARIPKNLIQDDNIKFVAACNDQMFGSMAYTFDSKTQTEDGNTKQTIPQEPHSNSSLTSNKNQGASRSPDSSSSLDIIHNILEKETDPVQLLCRALRIPVDHKQLDQCLSGKCRRLRITEHFTGLMMNEEADSESEWPTLLHFCADTNLLLSTNELLQVPCLVSACLKCNRNNETPRDIAKRNGFTDLVKLLDKQVETEHVKVSRLGSRDSGVLDPHEDCYFPADPNSTSMRDKNGVKESRDADSGVSGLQHSFVGRDSDYLDMSPTRISKAPKKGPTSFLNRSVSDIRPSGDYDKIHRSWMSKSYQGREEPDPFSDNFSPLSEGRKEGETTWFVETPPAYRFTGRRRCSESDTESLRRSKALGSPGQKKSSFSKTISKVFKLKRKNSMSSNPDSTIPEEANNSNDQISTEGRGFPCSPIMSYEDLEEQEAFVSTEPPIGRSSPKGRHEKQHEEPPEEPPKRSFKKIKNPFRKKVDRRKSLRSSRVLKDNNVVVLALPSKQEIQI